MSIMQARLAAKGGGDCGNDLLGLLLEAWTPQRRAGAETLTTDEVIDECKTFFAAGQETTATQGRRQGGRAGAWPPYHPQICTTNLNFD